MNKSPSDLHMLSKSTDELELKLDEADKEAASTDVRHTHDEVFSRVRARIDAGQPHDKREA